MNSVWVVTSGEYDDYHVEAIFSSEQEALDWIGPISTNLDVEEWELGGGSPCRIVGAVLLQFVNGELTYRDTRKPNCSYARLSIEGNKEIFTIAVPIAEYTEESVKQAIKIATEKRALALNNLKQGLINATEVSRHVVSLNYETMLPGYL